MAIAKAESEILQHIVSKEQLQDLHEQYIATQCFVEAMSKDGISLDIIRRNLSLVNRSIESLLTDNTDFKIWLEEEDKEITVYFQEKNCTKRAIELCSGMEKTIAAICIRSALISITSLPVSNIFILDESLTALDTEHLEVIGRILTSLKSVFDTIFVICHDEYIKDLCDDVVVIEKNEQGYSRILN